jgi:hypothetical protein
MNVSNPSTRINSNRFDIQFSYWIKYFSNFSRRQNVLLIQGIKKVTQPMEKCSINFIFIIMHISYNKCWKCPPSRSSQRCTRRITLANTFCNVPVDVLSTVRWMLAWSSCSVCVCGWFEYTVSLRCPHENKVWGAQVRGSWRPQYLWNEASRKHRFQVSHGLCDFLNTQ